MLVLAFVLCALAAWFYYRLAARAQSSSTTRAVWAAVGFILCFVAQRFMEPFTIAVLGRGAYRRLLVTYSDAAVIAVSCLIAGAFIMLLGWFCVKLLLRLSSLDDTAA